MSVIGILAETAASEQRVALTPSLTKDLTKCNSTVQLATAAGTRAGFPDQNYNDVNWQNDNQSILANSDITFCVQAPTANDLEQIKPNSILIGLLAPQQHPSIVKLLQEKNITSFSMEFLPRITRAQSMDVLSSQATAAGYKAALLAASHFQRFFPMLTTAAGSIRPATVLVVGAGVAGLQAIATSNRLGAIVTAYDIRPDAKEQIQSLGAKMIDIGVSADASGGYARELTSEEKQQQRDGLAAHIAKTDVIITTAAIPGRPAPKIIDTQMVEGMQAGSLIVDIAAEMGGNCELTQAGETITQHDVQIMGPVNLPSQLATHASQMYAKNLINFTKLFLQEDGCINLDWDDEILSQTVLTHAGELRREL